MPKMKTHRGAAKRFRRTATGKFKRGHGYRRHLMEAKSRDRKRKLRKPGLVSKQDSKRISKLLPYS